MGDGRAKINEMVKGVEEKMIENVQTRSLHISAENLNCSEHKN